MASRNSHNVSRGAGVAPESSVIVRCIAAAGAALSLLLAGTAASAFLSSLYASTAADVVRHSDGHNDGIGAAQLAARLAPWRSVPRRYLAQSLSAGGQLPQAIEQGEAAVRHNPADAYAWTYLARLTGAQPPLGDRVLAMYRMALSRSPNTFALRQAIAIDGVLRWNLGDAALQSLWRESMSEILRHDRKPLLAEIVKLNQDRSWCATHRSDLPIGQWCDNVARLRIQCSGPDLPRKAEAWCRSMNLLMQQRPP